MDRRRSRRRLAVTAVIALACAGIVATATAAPASGGRHLPYFSALDERVAIKKLPLEMRLLFRGLQGVGGPHSPAHGPVWFGEVERPNSTIVAAGTKSWVCETEQPKDVDRGGDGTCVALRYTRQLHDLSVGSCGRSPRFRIHGLAPDGVTGLAVERSDGTIGRTVPVIDNTFAFSIGHEDITLRGVGDAGAERLERKLPLGGPSGGSRGGCTTHIFSEESAGKQGAAQSSALSARVG